MCFTCSKDDTIHILNGPRNPANGIATFSQTVTQYEFAVCSITNITLHTPHNFTTALIISSQMAQQTSLASSRLTKIFKPPQIISTLLSLALKLETSNNRNHTFYTDSAFS